MQIMEAQVRAMREQGMKELQDASMRMRNAILESMNAEIAKTPEVAGGYDSYKERAEHERGAVLVYHNDNLELTGT
ncbi:MAG: hypothetical protein QM757_36305 [Paludibaculum sp.]